MISLCCKVVRISAVLVFTLSLLLVAEPSFAQPTITSHTPDQNTLDVSADTNIVVQFSEAIDGATVNENTFNVDGSMTGEIAGAFSGGGTKTITLDPALSFEPGEVVTVTLTTGIETAGGVSLDGPYTWQFTVASREAFGEFGPQQIISTNADGAFSVYAADMDGDGDMDVLATSENLSSGSGADDHIAWFENGNAWNKTVISSDVIRPQCVYAADIDGDGDLDVLSASRGDDKIAWYENTDGAGTFGAQQIITSSADYAQSVYTADIDGDGDLDVLSASRDDNKIAWYENGSTPNWNETVISNSAGYAQSVYAADMDEDGDLDVLSASGDDKIAWYENGSAPNWNETVISNSADYALSVYAADLDEDGDMDVLSASYNDNKIAWYENGNAWHETVICSGGGGGAWSVHAADLDGDGDMDILSAFRDADKVAWYENGNAWNETQISTNVNGPKSVYAADLDGDGDLDVLSASSGDDKIAWYKNKPGASLAPVIIMVLDEEEPAFRRR